MRSAYLLIDAASLAFPLAFSASRRFGFGRAWPLAWAAVAFSALPFGLWDIAFARAGVWDFNPAYVLGPAIFGLPLEEWLFFFAIPFACLFIYQRFAASASAANAAEVAGAAGAMDAAWVVRPGRGFVLAFACLSAAFAAMALAHTGRAYTLSVGLAAAVAAAALAWSRPRYARAFLPALAVQYVPFLIVNGLLTALPVVRYRADAILGPRILSIPVEDAAFAFVMFVLPVAIYEALIAARPVKEAAAGTSAEPAARRASPIPDPLAARPGPVP
jgi:lycopene cyclase domain-containing protein